MRLTHIPSGITVSMQDGRSQHQVCFSSSFHGAVVDIHDQNKRRAFQVLAARLMDQKLTREMAERRAIRQNLVKTADRSEKIRTYNYAQVRRRTLVQRNLVHQVSNSRIGLQTTGSDSL